MGLGKAAILFIALLFLSVCLYVMIPTMAKDKPTDSFYLDTNLSVNKTNGAIQPVIQTGGSISGVSVVFAGILFLGGAFIFLSRRKT